MTIEKKMSVRWYLRTLGGSPEGGFLDKSSTVLLDFCRKLIGAIASNLERAKGNRLVGLRREVKEGNLFCNNVGSHGSYGAFFRSRRKYSDVPTAAITITIMIP